MFLAVHLWMMSKGCWCETLDWEDGEDGFEEEEGEEGREGDDE